LKIEVQFSNNIIIIHDNKKVIECMINKSYERSFKAKKDYKISLKSLTYSKVPYLYLMPAIIIFSVIIIFPIFQAFYISLFRYDGIRSMVFIYFQNYSNILKDAKFYNALKNTGIFMLLNVIIQNSIAIPLAVILNSKILMSKFFKSLYFIPSILSVVVIGFIFQFIFNPVFGVLNEFLRQIGLSVFALNWLGDTRIALFSVIFVTCWQGIGYGTVIYLGGLQSISADIYEAAEIDGSHGVNTFLKITFPLLAPVFTVSIIVSTITNIREFGRIFVMTKGGPAGATDVIVTYLFRNFESGYLGYGSAVSVLLFIIIVTISFFQIKILSKRENY